MDTRNMRLSAHSPGVATETELPSTMKNEITSIIRNSKYLSKVFVFYVQDIIWPQALLQPIGSLSSKYCDHHARPP